MSLIFRRPWSKQPTVGIGVHRAGLASGLVHSWGLGPNSLRVRDAANSAEGIFGTGITLPSGNYWVAGPQGYYLLFDATGTGNTTSKIITVGNSVASGSPRSNAFSVQCRIRVGSLGTEQSIYAGGPTGLQFRVNSGGTLTLNKTYTAAIGTSSGTISAGVDVDVGVSYDGTTATFYIDGKASGSGSSAQTFDAVQYFLGAIDSAASLGELLTNGSRIYYLHVWNRPRGVAEFAAIAANPWQVFTPSPAQYWAPTTAGGISVSLTGSSFTGSVGTLTSAIAQTLTGSSSTTSTGSLKSLVAYTLSGNSFTANTGTAQNTVGGILSGSSVALTAGTIVSAVSYTLNGTAVTASQGIITASTGGAVSVNLSGSSVTISTGTMVSAISNVIAGSGITSSVGILVQTISQSLSGDSISTTAGTLTSALARTLSGSSVTLSTGTLSALTGSTITIKAGSWIRYRTI